MAERFTVSLRLYLGTLGFLVLVSVAYSITTRTPGDYLLYTSLLTVIWALMIVKWAMELRQAAGRPLPEPSFRGFLRVYARAIPLAIASYGIAASFKDLYLWAASAKYGLVVSCIALIFGAYLFLLRERARILYGATEVAVGLLVAGFRSDPATSFWDLSSFIPFLTAGVYLVVRGFDNISQGLRSSTPDPLVVLLRRLRGQEQVSEMRIVRRVKSVRERKGKLMVLKERLRRRQAEKSDFS